MDGDFNPETGEVTERLSMPPAIAAAIIAVKKQVKQLGADDRNEHGKYNFVSVDKFYERIGKLMAEAGLALLIDETSTEVKGSEKSGNPWLFVQYSLAFLHESGAMSAGMRRSCALPINGPQTYGAAQSYIEKQFLRQVFKVPTGERDADETVQSDTAPAGGRTAQGSSGGTRTPPSRQQAAPAPSAAKDEADKRWREIRADIEACMTVPELESLDGCLAWTTCAKMIEEAEGSKDVAEIAMGNLRTMIEKRKAMLVGDGGYR